MINNVSIERKLVVTLLIEPGCLGPDGANLVDNFCETAQKLFSSFGADSFIWQFSPRTDKTLAEINYSINGKSLNPTQAGKYLQQLSALSIDLFEEQLNDRITFVIEQYQTR